MLPPWGSYSFFDTEPELEQSTCLQFLDVSWRYQYPYAPMPQTPVGKVEAAFESFPAGLSCYLFTSK